MEDKKEEGSLVLVKRKDKDKRVTSLSFGGEVYEADKDGLFEVPEAALAELTSHGFVHVPD